MIPADHWHDNGDGTAWLVTSADPAEYGWAIALDRPCDACQGDGSVPVGPNGIAMRWDRCLDCIDGRHTFDIVVEHPDGPCDHARLSCDDIGCEGLTKTYRVSIVPGMVLPIVDGFDADYPSRCIILLDPPFGGLVNSRRDGWGNYPEDNLPLPPAAAPDMWAVKLRVAE